MARYTPCPKCQVSGFWLTGVDLNVFAVKRVGIYNPFTLPCTQIKVISHPVCTTKPVAGQTPPPAKPPSLPSSSPNPPIIAFP
ncbi:hypothetical protein L1987_73411 [Smallanthus sonchifolius]|uniref:Uncharacterized protein n=1 Tax=Smallanthus sonchifolius TaxID=185202 RepID=A0ACB9A0V6_9ASTR|nr:hypothetical protein L1987_73411 [Smallanthus sonchifolius]